MTPPNAFVCCEVISKNYLMCNSAAHPPQHLRKLTLYCKPPTIEPRHAIYISLKTTSKMVAITSLLLLIASAAAEVQCPPSAAYRAIFPSLPPKQLPASPQSRADMQHVEEHEYVALENCFSPQEAEAAKAKIERLSTKDGRTVMGRNVFEGVNTTRIYSLLNK